MSYEKILNVLTSFGLSREDVRVYLNLAVNGPQTIQVIQGYLQRDSTQVLMSIRKLEESGLVNAIKGEFIAIPFEDALKIVVDANLSKALNMEINKDKILKQWQSYINQKTNLQLG